MTKYDLMKIIYNLDRESKEIIFDGWDSFVASSEKNFEKISIKETLVKNSRLYDPETSDNMLTIIELLEKFLDIDNNISYNNICLFTHPLNIGSKKLTLRPYRIVSLVRSLENIAKKFARESRNENKRSSEFKKMKKEFKQILEEIKNRLISMENEIVTRKKERDPNPPIFSEDEETERKIKLKMKTPQKIAARNLEKRSSTTVEDKVRELRSKGFSQEQILKILENFDLSHEEILNLNLQSN